PTYPQRADRDWSNMLCVLRKAWAVPVHCAFRGWTTMWPPDGSAVATDFLKGDWITQRSNSDRVILEKSGPEIPRMSASRVEGTSISRNVCLMSTRRLKR